MEHSVRKAQLMRSIRSRYTLQSLSPCKIWRAGNAAKGEPPIVSVSAPVFIAESLI